MVERSVKATFLRVFGLGSVHFPPLLRAIDESSVQDKSLRVYNNKGLARLSCWFKCVCKVADRVYHRSIIAPLKKIPLPNYNSVACDVRFMSSSFSWAAFIPDVKILKSNKKEQWKSRFFSKNLFELLSAAQCTQFKGVLEMQRQRNDQLTVRKSTWGSFFYGTRSSITSSKKSLCTTLMTSWGSFSLTRSFEVHTRESKVEQSHISSLFDGRWLG